MPCGIHSAVPASPGFQQKDATRCCAGALHAAAVRFPESTTVCIVTFGRAASRPEISDAEVRERLKRKFFAVSTDDTAGSADTGAAGAMIAASAVTAIVSSAAKPRRGIEAVDMGA